MHSISTQRRTSRHRLIGLIGLIVILASLGIAPPPSTAGTSFGPPQTLATGGFEPAVAAVGDLVYVVWSDADVLLRRSEDGGASFLPVQPIGSNFRYALSSLR